MAASGHCPMAKAPVTATVRVVGQFQAGDAAPMQVAVRHNNTVRFSATDAGAFDLTVNVTAGDTLNFAVFGGYAFGSTGLQVTLAATTFSLPLTTGEAGKISLGAWVGGSSVSLAVTGTGDLGDARWSVNPDGSLAAPASAPWAFARPVMISTGRIVPRLLDAWESDTIFVRGPSNAS